MTTSSFIKAWNITVVIVVVVVAKLVAAISVVTVEVLVAVVLAAAVIATAMLLVITFAVVVAEAMPATGVAVATVLVRALVCAAKLAGTFVAVLRVNEPITAPRMAVDLLVDAFIGSTLGDRTNIDVGVLADMIVNALPRAITVFEIDTTDPCATFRC